MRLHKITWKVGVYDDWYKWETQVMDFLGIDVVQAFIDEISEPSIRFVY